MSEEFETPGKITGHTRSILLQVAYKGAIELAAAGKIDASGEAIEGATVGMYDRLIKLHVDRKAGDTPKSGGGYGGGRGGGQSDRKWDKPFEVVKIDYFGNGTPIEFQDRRPAKRAGKYSAKAADFQSVSKFDLGDGKGEQNVPIWLNNQDGTANETARSMVAAAGVSLEEPAAPATESASAATTAPF